MKKYVIAALFLVGVAGSAEAQKAARTSNADIKPRLKTTTTQQATKAPKVKRSETTLAAGEGSKAPITSRLQARNKEEALQADAYQRQQSAQKKGQ